MLNSLFLSVQLKVNGEIKPAGYPFTSKDDTIPTDPYGQSKYEAEQGLLKLAKEKEKEMEMEIVIIRPPLSVWSCRESKSCLDDKVDE